MTSAFARGASKMTGIKCVHHIGTFRASYFAYDDPVRSHSKSGSYHHSDINFTAAVRTGETRFHPDEIIDALKIELSRILDGYDSFIRRNESGQCVKKCCLAASCAAA